MIPYSVKDLKIDEPIVNEKAKSKVVKEISNAWKNTSRIDYKGWVWVRKDKLHSILRTTKNNIEYIFMQIPDQSKATFGNETYVRGYEVLKLIAKSIEESGTGTKGMYLETSKQFYDAISSCEKARLLRLEYENQLKSQSRLLKRKRINAYHIKNDESAKARMTGKSTKTVTEKAIEGMGKYAEYVEGFVTLNNVLFGSEPAWDEMSLEEMSGILNLDYHTISFEEALKYKPKDVSETLSRKFFSLRNRCKVAFAAIC